MYLDSGVTHLSKDKTSIEKYSIREKVRKFIKSCWVKNYRPIIKKEQRFKRRTINTELMRGTYTTDTQRLKRNPI